MNGIIFQQGIPSNGPGSACATFSKNVGSIRLRIEIGDDIGNCAGPRALLALAVNLHTLSGDLEKLSANFARRAGELMVGK